uniref:Uncharacterized protein n=1 Tax=Piliocolobus tephrosceles TaxID=591936 RepID=A0A8C9GTB9_9PRIM
MFCRTSANFGIAYPLPILGKVLLLVDPSEGRVWCTWAVLPSSAWVMDKRAVVWPESWGKLGRAHRLCDEGSPAIPPSPTSPLVVGTPSTCPKPGGAAADKVWTPWWEGEGGILASRINAWNIGQCHGHLETLSCASAKPGNF